jgi:hypothetical protein
MTAVPQNQRTADSWGEEDEDTDPLWAVIRTPDQTPAVIRVILRVFICGSQTMKEQFVTKKRVQLKKTTNNKLPEYKYMSKVGTHYTISCSILSPTYLGSS